MVLQPTFRLTEDRAIWLVPSQTMPGVKYRVFYGSRPTCTCEDCRLHGGWCKHIWAVHYWLMQEEGDELPALDDIEPEDQPPAQKRNWSAYRKAREDQKEQFQILLRDLCRPLKTPMPTSAGGRPRVRLSDAVFAIAYKVYCLFPSDRFMGDLHRAHEDGFITQVPSRNSLVNYMGDETLTPILKELIKVSSKPLRVLETGHWAQDATGITVYRYRRWIDEREGTEEQKRDWIKLTLFCGVKTKMVAAVDVIDGIANESPHFPRLLDEVAEHNRVLKVSADAGFSSVSNLTATAEIGAYPYIPFKDGATGGQGGL